MKTKLFVALIAAFAVLAPGVRAEEAKKADAAKPAEKKAEKKEEKGAKKEEKKGSDTDVLKERAEALTKALQKNDITTVLGYFGEDFTSPMIKDKASLKALLEMGSNSGTFNGLTADNSKAKYTIDGDKATVGPSTFQASGESGTATFTCKKKDGDWKIVGLDLTGVNL